MCDTNNKLRDTNAGASIKGHCYAIWNAISYLLDIQEDEYISCEYKNSDIFIYKDNKCISIESKHYSSNIGWGDECFKNSIRNFIDIEIENPFDKYIFYTNTSMRNSIDLKKWMEYKSFKLCNLGNRKDVLYELESKISGLYINELTKGKKDPEEIEKIKMNAKKRLGCIVLDDFISKVEFKFDSKVTYNTTIELVKKFLKKKAPSLQEDAYKVFACLQDKVLMVAIEDEKNTEEKILRKSTVDEILHSLQERYSEIEKDVKRKQRIEALDLEGELSDKIRRFLDNDDIYEEPEIKKIVQERLDLVIEEIVLYFGNVDNWNKYIKNLNKKDPMDINDEDIKNLIIFVIFIEYVYGIEVDKIFTDMKIYNMNLCENKIGYYCYGSISYKASISRWIAEYYENIDIFTNKNKCINKECIILNCKNVKQCRYGENYNMELNRIVFDISKVNEDSQAEGDFYQKELIKYFRKDYHCGMCIDQTDALSTKEIENVYRRLFG